MVRCRNLFIHSKICNMDNKKNNNLRKGVT